MTFVVKKYKGDSVNFKHFEEIIQHFEKQKQTSNEEVKPHNKFEHFAVLK